VAYIIAGEGRGEKKGQLYKEQRGLITRVSREKSGCEKGDDENWTLTEMTRTNLESCHLKEKITKETKTSPKGKETAG